ncbi:zeta toxin family protein [Desulfoluna spongiiphila]|uniref:zeta toxin family protein n=1 Tax=Desulfoluna spongiiphila TaxID=419481 RepID=UPI001255226B|nr:zeta toxin family protein [Desulfoluna spongiiphila]VVS95367.1 zeta toxin domain [Desulfoluna spongiiphila]
MRKNFSRPLTSEDVIKHFLKNALSLDDDSIRNVTPTILSVECCLEERETSDTLSSASFRDPEYESDEDREALREKIYIDLVKEERLEDDDDITPEKGGAKPKNLKSNREAVILTGLPASGKSTVANAFADHFGAYIVDCDYAKRKLPEYDTEGGASLLHKESNLITLGLEQNRETLFNYCRYKGHNMVIPKIGYSKSGIFKLRDVLVDSHYKVHLVLTSLDRKESCKRALYRFIDTERYVPLGLVFDGYANDSILSYYRVRDDDKWESIGKIMSINHKIKVINCDPNSPVNILAK